ncbi:MAG: LptF/LptG family permease [Melioribacteraceae bacterium]|nr:LptF/LptG family permease [Melioribacteraceae bacterium]
MILFRYISKNHLLPFIFSTGVLIAVFLLQFLMKTADKLVGKGLDFWVIVKLVIYNLGWIVVLVIPMAVLVATLMAFGNMAQNNEVAIMKASGISLYKMLVPPLLGSMLIATLLILFNNTVYPETNHALKILMRDISRKKPTLSLVPGVFSNDIPKYSILARKINPLTNELGNVTIYDKSDPNFVNVVTAESGKIYFSGGQKKLLMDLKNGEIHQYDLTKTKDYQILYFDIHRISMPGDQFTFQQSETGGHRSDRELSAQDMIKIVDSLGLVRDRYISTFSGNLVSQHNPDSTQFYSGQTKKSAKHIYLRVEDKIKTASRIMKSDLRRIDSKRKQINKYWVEIHKKYSIPVACIVFILIGAPLGTMTRKGGFGVAAGISLIFFIIYWAFLIGGEKLADRNLLSPFWGMWSANIVLGILGIYLTVKSARERITLDFNFINKLIPKKFRENFKTDENS